MHTVHDAIQEVTTARPLYYLELEVALSTSATVQSVLRVLAHLRAQDPGAHPTSIRAQRSCAYLLLRRSCTGSMLPRI